MRNQKNNVKQASRLSSSNVTQASSLLKGKKMKKPNVLIIMTDEQRWDTIGATGVLKGVNTPYMDSLARDGVNFTNCHTPYPLCCPARTSMVYSLHMHNHHVINNWREMKPELRDKGLIRPFIDAGYYPLYYGKWHISGSHPKMMGIEDYIIPDKTDGRDWGSVYSEYNQWVRERGYQLGDIQVNNETDEDFRRKKERNNIFDYGVREFKYEDIVEKWLADNMLNAMDNRPKDKPFFCFFSFNIPHFPHLIPESYQDEFTSADDIYPKNYLKANGPVGNLVKDAQKQGAIDKKLWDDNVVHYHCLNKVTDDIIGIVIDYLKKTGEYDDTIIVLTSDHGDMMGSLNQNYKGLTTHYDEATKVPFIITGPGIPKDKKCDHLCTLMDILPSLAENCGVEIKDKIDGKSILSLIQNPDGPAIHDKVMIETMIRDKSEVGSYCDPTQIDPNNDIYHISIRTAKERFIFRFGDMDEFYDLESDPEQYHNIAEKHPKKVRSYLKYIRDEIGKDSQELADYLASHMDI